MTPSTIEVGQALVRLYNDGKTFEFIDSYYGGDAVSVEGSNDGPLEGRIEGFSAVRAKSEWWWDNHEVHSTQCEGPFIGQRPDTFAVRYLLDVTPTGEELGGERMQMIEIGMYTVANGKIVHEEFLYGIG